MCISKTFFKKHFSTQKRAPIYDACAETPLAKNNNKTRQKYTVEILKKSA